jgi:hypothetical protein
MKKIKIAFLLMSMPFFSMAGEANVTWKDFNDYRDVAPGNEVKGAYHKRVAKQFENHLAKLAEQLPKGYKLNVTFMDIDLAGDARMSINDVRVIKPIYFPRLTISYNLKDSKGRSVARVKDLVLKDMSFMDKIKTGREVSFYYEKRLLSDWFEEQVLPEAKSIKS